MADDAALSYAGPERRAPVDLGPFAGLPDWMRGMAIVGIPGVIALFLTWFLVQTLPEIKTEMMAYRMEAERSRTAIQTQLTQQEQIYRMLQKICSNLAKTDEERSRCFDR